MTGSPAFFLTVIIVQYANDERWIFDRSPVRSRNMPGTLVTLILGGERLSTSPTTPAPHCGASDRERLYALYLKEIAAASGGRIKPRMPHFAPEHALSAMIRQSGMYDYHTADLISPDVDDRVDITRMDIYPDAAVDAFLCSHVLEHVLDDIAAIRELHRILKPSGWGILMAPLMTHLENTLEDSLATTEAERWRLFGQGDHVRLYAKQDFLCRVQSNGFHVTQLGMEHFGKVLFDRCGITPSSVLYVVSHD